MNKGLSRTLTVAGLGLALAVPTSFGSSAFADPNSSDVISLTCGDVTYQAVVGGGGSFTPAHDLHSNLVFIPHSFYDTSFDVFDADGNLVNHFDDPTVQTQGSGKQKNDTRCTYTFRQVSDGSDPTGPPAGYTLVGTGHVSGQVAGHA